MTSVEDFTTLPAGADVALEGRVSRCARCGRNGIEQGRGEGPSYYVIHVQVSRLLGDGMLTQPSDFCVFPDADTDGSDGHARKSAPLAPVSLERPPARA